MSDGQALPVRIRRATKRDIPFITNSWLRSLRNAPQVQGIPNNTYYYQHHKLLEQLIPRSVVLVICNENDEDQILGWCCAEVVDTALVVHYVYIKHPFRKLGLATRLVKLLEESEQPPAIMHTHMTEIGRRIVKEKDWVFNPYLAWTKLPEDWNHASD